MDTVSTIASLTWKTGISGQIAFTGDFKISKLIIGVLVEHVDTDRMPTGELGLFDTVEAALVAISRPPKGHCHRCGQPRPRRRAP